MGSVTKVRLFKSVPGLRIASNVLRPGVAAFGGVFLRDLIAVTEHFGDEGSGNL